MLLMRIIAGKLKGRIFDSPHGHRTHPMSDKMRGAIFTILGDIGGMHVCDAFSGSGALAFEAISRGAGSVVAVESDRHAQQTITINIHSLGVNARLRLIKATIAAWLSTSTTTFDIVLADPPYDALQEDLLPQLASRVKPDGLFVLSWPGGQPLPTFKTLTLITNKIYGDAQLAFYRIKP